MSYVKIGVAGPVGSGKTALIESLTRKMAGDYSIGAVSYTHLDVYKRQIFGKSLNAPLTKIMMFYATLTGLVLVFALCRFLTNRRIGKVFLAIRDGESRAGFVGYNTAVYKV